MKTPHALASMVASLPLADREKFLDLLSDKICLHCGSEYLPCCCMRDE